MPDKFPLVFMDRVLPDRNYDSVILDCREATAKMLEEMIGNGFRKIGFLVGLPQISPTYERVSIYQEILNKHGIPEEEQYIDQKLRQEAFDNYETTDDHGMVFVGTAVDQNGTKYYKVKNSWGTEQIYGGFFYASEAFVKYKTMDILVHKDAVPVKILKKLHLK